MTNEFQDEWDGPLTLGQTAYKMTHGTHMDTLNIRNILIRDTDRNSLPEVDLADVHDAGKCTRHAYAPFTFLLPPQARLDPDSKQAGREGIFSRPL